MELALLFVLLPGIIAYGISRALCGLKHVPITNIMVSLALQSAIVFFLYSLLAQIAWLNIPDPIHIAAIFSNLKSLLKPEEATAFINSNGTLIFRGLSYAFATACAVGLAAALENDKRFLRQIGRHFGTFQSTESDTEWADLIEISAASCWMQFRTKDGRTLSGPIAAVSWEFKDGGVGLQNVHILDEQSQKFEPIAQYLYVPTAEIDGPIFLTKPILKGE